MNLKKKKKEKKTGISTTKENVQKVNFLWQICFEIYFFIVNLWFYME